MQGASIGRKEVAIPWSGKRGIFLRPGGKKIANTDARGRHGAHMNSLLQSTKAAAPLLLAMTLVIWQVGFPAEAQDSPQTEEWGASVDGLQIRLIVADGPKGPSGIPALQIQLRNQGSIPRSYMPVALAHVEFEIDGVWGRLWGRESFGGPYGPPVEILPGQETALQDLLVHILTPSLYSRTPFNLAPGRHSLRVRSDSGAEYARQERETKGAAADREGRVPTKGFDDFPKGKLADVLTSNLVYFEVPVQAGPKQDAMQ